MQPLILYHTKYGSSKLYAEWLREDLGRGEIRDLRGFDATGLRDFGQIVIVSSIYIGKVGAMDFMVHHWGELLEKQTYLLVVGSAEPGSEESKQAYMLIPREIREGLNGYHKLPGKIDFQKLSFIHKLMLWFKGIRKSEDKMDRAALQPVIQDLIRA
ncbi:hypothetical protein KIH41_08490 [Litoribacter ruber]|uniref:flavodoxin domain-containing protein n=1 Tax=Litoribacter ruber TaxID=702568 RepID=UPI001BD9277F|nr:flavodoxin domain-containing protein [Litoribacter ruber]MBT0811316.1 hypothetical protein [Litoribacter ruber]